MDATGYQGNVSVTAVKDYLRWKGVRDNFVKRSIVDYGLPIRTGSEPDEAYKSNSEIIYGFPEEAAVKGLVHDAAVNLYRLELGFRTLEVEPSLDQFEELLEGSIEGRRAATPELKHRINSLERKYGGISPGNLLGYKFEDGDTVEDKLHDIAEFRHRNWEEDTSNHLSVKSEESLFEAGISGRVDLSIEKEEGKQRREIKITDEASRRQDIIQSSLYWLVEADDDTSVVLEYPLQDKRLVFEPGEDENDFDPTSIAADVYDARDLVVETVNNLRERQRYYLDRGWSRERATRKALGELEVQ